MHNANRRCFIASLLLVLVEVHGENLLCFYVNWEEIEEHSAQFADQEPRRNNCCTFDIIISEMVRDEKSSKDTKIFTEDAHYLWNQVP